MVIIVIAGIDILHDNPKYFLGRIFFDEVFEFFLVAFYTSLIRKVYRETASANEGGSN